MPLSYDVVARPESAGVDPSRLAVLVERVRREVDEGLLPSCQLAVARDGRLVWFETVGAATNHTRYCVFSATKGVVAGAVWLLIGDGRLDPSAPVVDLFPEFGANGKSAVTVEHLLVHSAGFPNAPMRPEDAVSRDRRIARMASWYLDWEPGTRFEYHPTSAHWVLAELITRASGVDHRDFIRSRIAEPLGLSTLRVGTPLDAQDDIAETVSVGEPLSAEESLAIFGVPELDLGEVTADNLVLFNRPDVRAAGVPGGGGVMTAADLALYYQALLHNTDGLWKPEVLADGTARIRCSLPDVRIGVPSNRTLGLIVAGDDGLGSMRGFGKTNSPLAFGHNGAGGQIAWADPATGLSFAYVTNGLDQNLVRQFRRDVSISSRAAACVPVD